MNSKRHRQYKKGAVKKQGRSVSNAGISKNSKKHDAYVAVWTLTKLGWSARRIANLKLPTSHHTVTDYLAEGCDLIKAGELPILAKSEGALRMKSFANPEYLHGKINQNSCGGGRRVKSHIYDSEYKDSFYGDGENSK